MPPEIVPTFSVGSPSSGVGIERELEVGERRDGPRERVDRVAAEVRCRAVGGDALGRRLARTARPCGRRGEPRRSARRRARRRRGRAGRARRPGTCALAAGLLGGGEHELEPGFAAAERRHALGGEHDRRHAALHVARPAADAAGRRRPTRTARRSRALRRAARCPCGRSCTAPGAPGRCPAGARSGSAGPARARARPARSRRRTAARRGGRRSRPRCRAG